MADDIFEIELEAMANGGSALGKHEGRVIFLPYAIPGEQVEARIVEERGRVAFAEGVRLLAASQDRVYPECPHFGPGRCGGCQWQHIDYRAQLLLKQDVLADQLERIGGFSDVEVRPLVPSPLAWHYNHQMTFLKDNDGALGLRGSSTAGRVVPVDVCLVLHNDLLDLYEVLDIDTSNLATVRLQIGTDGKRMVVLYAESEEAPALELDLPASINLVLPDNEPINLAGDTHTRYQIGEHTFRATAGSAFRSNVAALPNLVQAVQDALGGATSILDLYAGVGVFGAWIAEQAEYVTLVESYPPAATDADENTLAYEHVDVIEGTVEDVLDAADPDEYDGAIIDPPRDGMSIEAMDALAALELPRLVYVSGDAATLSRDAKRLAAHGYRLDYVQPLDMAPHTYYTESVARFTRKA